MIETVATPCFRQTLRVYWEDTDATGVVFYANYLKFFERARTEWLRSLGFEQQRMLAETGTMFVVASTTVRYLRPARLDDLLDVTVLLRDARNASMHLEQQILRKSARAELLAESTIRIGCVESGTLKPQRIPSDILRTIQ
jgi:acyl-CoA thioester hydrolase